MTFDQDVRKAILQYLAESKGAGTPGIRRRLRKRFPAPRIPQDVGVMLEPLLTAGLILRVRGLYCLPEDAAALEERRGSDSEAPRPKSDSHVEWKWADGRTAMISKRHARKLEAQGLRNHAQPMPRPVLKYATTPGRTRNAPLQNLPPDQVTDIRTLGLPHHDWLVDD